MAMMNKMMNAMMDSMSPDEKQDTMLKLMPNMIKQIKRSDITGIFRDKFYDMMFVTHKSRFDFSETLQKIKESGIDHGWYHPMINNHFEMEKDLRLAEPNRVATVSMCIPRSAYEILKDNKKLAVMMPLQINVYEEDGQVYVVWLNIKMMGKLMPMMMTEKNMAKMETIPERMMPRMMENENLKKMMPEMMTKVMPHCLETMLPHLSDDQRDAFKAQLQSILAESNQ